MNFKVIVERSLQRGDLLTENKVFWKIVRIITSQSSGKELLNKLSKYMSENAFDVHKYFYIKIQVGKIEIWEQKCMDFLPENRLCVIYFE